MCGLQEDILLTNVAGFDIRVYSPNAPIMELNDQQELAPGDPHYDDLANPPPPAPPPAPEPVFAEGAFVDLGWLTTMNPAPLPGWPGWTDWFGAAANAKSQLVRTWDSWSPHYEYNGVNDDAVPTIDQGTNGLDDGGIANVVDDEEERETMPPYPYPIRALRLTMRGIEKSTRNIRQVTITSSFVPE